MMNSSLVMYDEDFRRVLSVIQRLVRDANAKGIYVVDKSGEVVAVRVGFLRWDTPEARALIRALVEDGF